MSVHSCYSADDWAKMTDCKVRVDGAWKQCKSIHANVDGAWKKVWPETTKVTITSNDLTLTAGTYTEEDITKLFWPNTEAYIEEGAATADTCKFIVTASNITGANADTWQVPESESLDLLLVDENGKYLTTTDAAGQIFAFCINIMLGSEEYTLETSDGESVTVTVSYLSTSTPYKSWAARYSGDQYFIGIVDGKPTNLSPTYSDDMDILSVVIPEGTYSLVVFNQSNDNYDNVEFINQLGSVTVEKKPSVTISTDSITLEGITTVAALADALQSAGFVATASNFPDGWVVPSSSTEDPACSTLVLNLVDSDGSAIPGSADTEPIRFTFIRGTEDVESFDSVTGSSTSTDTYGSDTTWEFVGVNETNSLPAGTYSFVLASYDADGLSDMDITFISGIITIKEAAKFTDPFYPYFSSTGNQHTTGIGLNQPSIFNDLVIRKYTSSSSEGELFPAGTGFRLDQKGQGSGYAIFYLNASGAVSSITNNSGWTISAFAADSAVLTAIDGGAYWWDGTKAVSSVTLTIN